MSAFVLAAAMAHVQTGGAPPSGRQLYTQYCESCHGADLRGGPAAPSIAGKGAADIDFWVSTGRMPAAVPWLQVMHRGRQPYLSPNEVGLIVRYVTETSPGGPGIPMVLANGDAQRGHAIFQQNCQHCHGVDGEGASIGGATWAPPLDNATVVQVAEAIRVGPGEMPQFGEHQLDQRDLDDVATYLSSKRGDTRFTGLPFDSGGEVPEGMYGWVAAGILCFFGFGFWSLDRKPPQPESSKEPPDAK